MLPFMSCAVLDGHCIWGGGWSLFKLASLSRIMMEQSYLLSHQMVQKDPLRLMTLIFWF
jgi:hypothetical protein